MPKRVIPVLQVSNGKLVKSRSFKHFTYIGDPVNAIKIFNEKGVDELFIVDVNASKTKKPDFALLEEMASESFIPLSYAGGIDSLKEIEHILRLGIERVAISSAGLHNMLFFKEAVKTFGSSTIIASVDVFFKRNNYQVRTNGGREIMATSFESVIKELSLLNVGEILVTSIDRDGSFQGHDSGLLTKVLNLTHKPVTIMGGVNSFQDVQRAFSLGANGVAVGSMFVFWGPLRAVLINYLDKDQIEKIESKYGDVF